MTAMFLIFFQVMRIAEKLTNNDQGYGLYMTDVSPENFAVNEKGEVFIIDAENIIVVDKQKIKTGLLFVYSLSVCVFVWRGAARSKSLL